MKRNVVALASLLATAAAATLALPLSAQPAGQPLANSAPMAPALPAKVPAARDEPFPGVIDLAIDASDVTRGLFRVTETIPVPPGTTDFTLLQPLWLPGNHGPTGTLALLAGLEFSVNGKPVAWTRDAVEPSAFHLTLPAGTRSVVAKLIHTAPLQTSEGRITMTREMLNLQWEKMSLYPAGHYARRIMVRPVVTFPAGWQAFTALDGRKAEGARVSWATVDYATLVDSPVFAGQHAQRWDVGQNIALSVVADEPGLLAIRPEHLQTYRNLAAEAVSLFRSRHFDHYDILLALTDRMGRIGLEHHRSAENAYDPRALVDWAAQDANRGVVSHELVHSWNGKFRRPAELWTPDYRQPMQTDLLWVYEGQTQFWGLVLAARSGIQSKEAILGALASNAALYSAGQPGRAWRAVEDTTRDPIMSQRRPHPWPSLERSEDYYSEAAMVWLEADQIIRERSGGVRSLDDFASSFFGIRDGDWGEVTYSFDDVVRILEAVEPYDWATFLKDRIYRPGQPAPLGGVEKGGYKLVWKDEPNPSDKGRMAQSRMVSLTYSLGLTIDKDAKVAAVLWDSPAFTAGIVPGAKLVAVDGQAYDPEVLRRAITAAKGTSTPIALLIQRGDSFQTVPVLWNGGLRYPWLERVGTAPTGLDRLLAPRTQPAK